MNLWSAVDKLSGIALPVLLGALLLLAVLYFNRGRLILWFLRRGTSLAEQIVFEILGIAGIEDPEWGLLHYPSRSHITLGLIVARHGSQLAVFIPSVPKLVPGQLVFVKAGDVKFLPQLTLREGVETLVTLGVASRTDVLTSILKQLEE